LRLICLNTTTSGHHPLQTNFLDSNKMTPLLGLVI
jgi:hypothetical protein